MNVNLMKIIKLSAIFYVVAFFGFNVNIHKAEAAIYTCTTVAGKTTWNDDTAWTGCGAVNHYPGSQSNASDTYNVLFQTASGVTFTLTSSPTYSVGSIVFPSVGAFEQIIVLNGFTLSTTNIVAITRPVSGGFNTIRVGSGTLNAARLSFGGTSSTRATRMSISTGTLTVTGSTTAAGTANPGGSQLSCSSTCTINIGGATTNAFPQTVNALNFATSSAVGTVNYSATGGSQKISAHTYNNLTLSNTSGSNKATLALTVNGTLTTTSGGTLDMSGYQLLGTITPTNNGTITSTSTANPAIPASKDWTGTTGAVTFGLSTGGQSIPAGTYNTLTFSNTSGTDTAVGALTVNGTMTTTSGGTLDMSTFQLLGTVTPTNNGTIKTSNTTNPAIPASKTWSGTTGVVNFAAATGAQSIPAGTYGALTLSNTSGTQTAVGSLTVSGLLTVPSGSTLAINSPDVLTSGTAGAVTVLTGGTVSGTGTTTIQNSQFTSHGTVSVNVRADATSGNISLVPRTYGGNLDFYSNSGSVRSVTIATSSAQTLNVTGSLIAFGDTSASAVVTLAGNTQNPTVNITKQIAYVKIGSATPEINTGSGTWTVSGNVNLTSGTFTATGDTLVMNGTSKTLTSNGNTLGTLTMSSCTTCTIADSLTSSGSVTLKSGMTVSGMTTFTMNGATKTLTSAGLTLGNVTMSSCTSTCVIADALTASGNVTLASSMTVSGMTTLTMTGTSKALTSAGNTIPSLVLTSCTTCTISDSLTTSGSLTLKSDMTVSGMTTLTMNGTSKSLTSAGFTLTNVDFSSCTTCTLSDDLTASGNVTLGSSMTLTSRKITMTGSSKNLVGAGNTLPTLTVDGSTASVTLTTSDLTASGVVTIGADDTFSVGSGRSLTSGTAGAISILTGGTMNGTGTTTVQNSQFSAHGTVNTNIRADATSGDVSLVPRTYGGNLEFYSNSSSNARVVTIATSTGQTLTVSGNLIGQAANTQNTTLTGATYNPAVTVTKNIQYVGGGSGTEIITSGFGAWTVSGNVDFTNGTYLATPQATSNGLVGHWALDGASSGSIANGTTAGLEDSSGNANNGTAGNVNGTGMAWSTGKIGLGAVSFDGADDVINAGQGSSLNNINIKTVVAWIKIDSITLDGIASKENTTQGWILLDCTNDATYCPSTANTLSFVQTFNSGANPGVWRGPANMINLNQWQQVAVVYDRTSTSNAPTFYVNGQAYAATLVLTPSGSADSDATYNMRIGNTSGGSDSLHGTIDDARVYNRALTAAEVSDLYNGNTLVMSGASKTLTPSTNTLNNLTLSGSITASASTTVTNRFWIQPSASFTAPSGVLSVGGNWIQHGTFTHNSGTVQFFSTASSTITGTTTFYNITANTPAKGLAFATSSTQTMSGVLTLAGTSGAGKIRVSSDAAGVKWFVNHQGTESVSNVAVKDSGCRDGSTEITAAGETDLGNNGTCWTFIVVTTFTQNRFRIYANTNGLTPSDPWPTGGIDLLENEALISGVLLGDRDIFRIRVNVTIAASNLSQGAKAFKLQYSQADTCSAATTWSAIGAQNSVSEKFRFYDNAFGDSQSVTTQVLSDSNIAGSYVEINPSPTNPNAANVGQNIEYDWSVQAFEPAASIKYCFRVVESTDAVFATYTQFPQVKSKSASSGGEVGDAGTTGTIRSNGTQGGGSGTLGGEIGGSAAPSTDPVAWWHFDEGTGNVTGDASGNGKTGTLAGSSLPTWTTGQLGGALTFNGVNNYVNIPSSSSFDFSASDYTISAWVNFDSIASQPAWAGIISKGDTVSGNDWSFQRQLSTDVLVLYNSDAAGGVATYTTGFSDLAGQGWKFIIFTRSGNNFTYYINAVSQGIKALTAAPTYNAGWPVKIGASRDPISVSGKIDDVRIYNRSLSLAEIQAIYNAENVGTHSGGSSGGGGEI